MKTYSFTTLTVGDEYLKTSLESYTAMAPKCSAKFNITTNSPIESIDRINIDKFSLPSYDDGRGGFSFHLNLKVLSLKKLVGSDLDYIVYMDGDWMPYTGFSEERMQNLFGYMENNELDFLFERPSTIGDHKKNLSNCFFQDKLRDYNVMDHTKWDSAHVVNEQFMVFKNNWKFRYFVQRWEMFLWYSIHNNIRNYPDGFEIGISALEAEMKYDFHGYKHYIRECFQFYTKSRDLHIRF